MKVSELRNKTVDELQNELSDLHREAFNLRMQKGNSETHRPHLYRTVRRSIARIHTVMTEKEQVADD